MFQVSDPCEHSLLHACSACVMRCLREPAGYKRVAFSGVFAGSGLVGAHAWVGYEGGLCYWSGFRIVVCALLVSCCCDPIALCFLSIRHSRVRSYTTATNLYHWVPTDLTIFEFLGLVLNLRSQ